VDRVPAGGGPQWIRNDLRGDLLKLDLLRSYPLRGASLVAAETASSALILTGLQLGLLVIALAGVSGGSGGSARLRGEPRCWPLAWCCSRP
jgi:hypothetical protein